MQKADKRRKKNFKAKKNMYQFYQEIHLNFVQVYSLKLAEKN